MITDQFNLSLKNPIISNHKAYGQELLPGLAYIDLIFQIFRQHGYHYSQLELRNLAIYHPLIVRQDNVVLLNIRCTEGKEDQWQIRVEGQERHQGTPTADKKRYITAEMHRITPRLFTDTLDPQEMKQSAGKTVNLKEIYEECRDRELVHTGFMKAEGEIFHGDGDVLIDISLGPEALGNSGRFMFHPVLLDGSGVGLWGVFTHLQQEQQRLFLPLYYESFRAQALLQKRCFTLIRTSSLQQKKELIYATMEFFNESGKKVGELKNITNKLVREDGLINPNRKEAPRFTLESPGKIPVDQSAGVHPESSTEVEFFLRQLLADRLKQPIDHINPQVGYYEMGLDSPGLLEIVRTIEKKIETTLSPTLLFEYTTIAELAAYLTENYAQQFGQADEVMPGVEQVTQKNDVSNSPIKSFAGSRGGFSKEPLAAGGKTDIAIIGMAGRYPGSRDLEEFWVNLKAGKDCISEIPISRWDWQRFAGLKSPSGKNISKWGGFIDDPDCFDPQFFRISPREAEMMDPQERLFLEICWEAIEDGGYTPKTLVPSRGRNKRRHVGVFVGVMHKDYTLVGAEAVSRGLVFPLSLNYAPIANRVSYFCNFHGPSMAIDTVCSSSLTAVHAALESISHGECEVALAGGVNLSLHPNKYMTYGLADLHSSDGYCHTFGKGGDGYVSGEGVGVVLLKPLTQAVHDRDHIYAVIKGSTINHVGTVSGITVPSPVAQADMIAACLEKTGIQPRTISCVEAHGTGTSLGDPIEIQGLVKAYRQYTQDRQFCSIGSVKSNIGHAESAAGISGLSKAALQLYHKTLVPSLHAEELNPYIDFKQSPFYVQHQTREWKQPVIKEGDQEISYPRRAGISSFGASGSNAHVILEEYLPRETPRQAQTSFITKTRPALVPLSAVNKERLHAYAGKLLEFLKERTLDKEGDSREINLTDLAYTLQVGREALEERVVFPVQDIPELTQRLEAFLENKSERGAWYQGHVKQNKDTLDHFTTDEDSKELIHKWIGKGRLKKLAELWAKGMELDWNLLYAGVKSGKPRRISLPTYPFARERYWIPEVGNQKLGARNQGTDVQTGIKGLEPQENAAVSERHLEAKSNEAYEIMTFTETWHEQALSKSSPIKIKTLVCFLSDPGHQQAFVEAMQTFDPQTRVIFISANTLYQRESQQKYSVDRSDGNSYQQAFLGIRGDFAEVDALLYLWALEDPHCTRDYSFIVYILQAMAAAKLKVGRFLLAAQLEDSLERCYPESWIGFERSLGLVLPHTQTAVIYQVNKPGEQNQISIKDWLAKLQAELQIPKVQSVLYQEGKRHIYQIRPSTIQPGNSPIKAGGTYLITGGCGGLGFLLARHFANTQPVNLVLTGRSPLDQRKKSGIKELEALGSQVLYIKADVGDSPSMKEGLKLARKRFGGIHGVIHAAGIQSNQQIFAKEIRQFQEVLKPKIKGTLVLDELLQEEPLDFTCYFSSSSAILGDFGACDYAIASRFQTAYARFRDQQQRQGLRQGKSIAFNWPLWKEGGMGFGDEESTKMYLVSSGQRFLETREGLAMFDRLLAQSNTQYLVLVGQPSRVHRFLGLSQDSPSHSTPLRLNSGGKLLSTPGKGWRREMKGLSLQQCLLWDLKEKTSQLLKIPRERLDKDKNLADFGFDSISLTEFSTLLTNHYNIEITPALFFGHSTLEKLSRYFLQEHEAVLGEFYREDAAGAAISASIPAVTTAPGKEDSAKPGDAVPDTFQAAPALEPIAIIGMSGRFPQARNIDEMWTILAQGLDVVKEIPEERWKWEEFYHPDPQEAVARGKSYGKWCGCIPGVSEFDPLFFEISPREAESMDPKQRILLQESWKALEDAGYGPARVKNSSIGMFVGVEEGDYHLVTGETGTITSHHNGILAARLAYFLDFSGPAMAINTACSSGLAAVHQACLSLRGQECDTAIAAGVSLILTPGIFVGMSQAGMLSPDGRCSAFDKKANGMVPGEAAAVVVLKRLSQARADGDQIYAIIKGSGINYDGKTNGITAPSGISQSNLLKTVYDRYRVNPGEIEYIVTHGTGTKLGDPVEINALADAFKDRTKKQGYCALTSNKTNFGHTFAASGLVNLINLVEAMRHETIPPSLHCEQENDYIPWQESPFYVNKTAKPWPREDGKSRIGAVSAFGMSGTNVHLVVQDYDGEEKGAAPQVPYYLLALSAKTRQALQERVKDMITTLQNRDLPGHGLSQISLTLLQGRHHFNFRCAIVIRDADDAVYVWKQLPDKGAKEKLPNLFQGEVPRDFTGQKAIKQYAQDLIKQCPTSQTNKDKYQEILCALADFYCQGYNLSWDQLYGENKPAKIHLPTYPFARESYWITGPEAIAGTLPGENLRPTDWGRIHGQAQDQLPGDSDIETDLLVSASVEHLKALLAEVTKIPINLLDPGAPFEELGLDSIMISNLNREIEQWVGKLDATLFFKYNRIQSLGAYLAETYPGAVSVLVNQKTVKTGKIPVPVPAVSARFYREPMISVTDHDIAPGIAIIGLAGRYPQAVTLEQFWQNLLEGKDCISEIPPQRWSVEDFYEEDPVKAVSKGLSYSKWGGFLDHIDLFDPLFFNISPLEAAFMDPQERLFLEVAWECLEDAGYTREFMKTTGDGNQIGVFAGTTFNNYQLIMAEAALQANQKWYAANSQIYSIANRVSYVMNFTGPSLVVDTACSSSLYAIHLACESINRGESRMAIAGGVNLSLHPSKYISLSQGQFNAPDGRCRAFCEGGTGYVPAEAVGAILLKPWREAVKDNDLIYGIIKGTAVNHGGKTNGYTVPNPVSQSLVIHDALKRSQVDPRSISCIEAHGTGTALGDPIEITGLSDAFGKYTKDTGYCSISSVKSNIGHAEAAAGIAQVTKVLLQLRHQTLVKNVMHGKGLNPNIDFQQTPFVVQERSEYWKRPVRDGRELPRRAGVSSFGAGGANAHLILEEHIPRKNVQSPPLEIRANKPFLIPLSAKNKDRLHDYAVKLLDFLKLSTCREAGLIDKSQYNRELQESPEQRIRALLSGILGVKAGDIKIEEKFHEYGIDTVQRTLLREKLQEEFAIEIKEEEFLEIDSVNSITAYFEKHHPGAFASVPGKNGAGAGEMKRTNSVRGIQETDLAALAYTLQVGREAMEERTAFLVEDIPDLIAKLEAFTNQREEILHCWRGQVKRGKEAIQLFNTDDDSRQLVQKWLENGKMTKIAELWVQGFSIDWNIFYGENKPGRISLPTYPFAGERCWVPETRDQKTGVGARKSAGRGQESGAGTREPEVSSTGTIDGVPVMHPLLQQNTSDFTQQRFSSIFTGQEFFLADHVVKGQRVLPGVAYLEMARAAVTRAAALPGSHTGIRLRNIVWPQPIVVGDQPVSVHIGLIPAEGDNGEIAFRIYQEPGEGETEPVIHSKGSAVIFSTDRAAEPDNAGVPSLDLPACQAQCSRTSFSSRQFYETFRAMGIEYGPRHQGVENIYVGAGQLLAKISLPPSLKGTDNGFMLHPTLMDSAFQAPVGLMMNAGEPVSSQNPASPRPPLPYALQELEVYGNCTPNMWALVKTRDDTGTGDTTQKLDIDLYDQQGTIRVRMKGFSTRVLEGEASPMSTGEPPANSMMLVPVWDWIPLEKQQTVPSPEELLVISGGGKDKRKDLQKLYPKAGVLEIQSQDTIEAIMQKFKSHGSIDHILWIAPDHTLESLTEEALLEDQNHGVFLVFKMIKALLALDYDKKALGWSFITIQTQAIQKNDRVNPTHAALHGLIGSLAKEYPKWKIRLIDLEEGCEWPLAEIFTLPSDPQGNAWGYRGGQWYRQQLVPFDCPPGGQSLYKKEGVYVVIGGGGGIGEAWSEYMIRTYQARIIWIGRREKDDTLQAKLDALSNLGPAPHYISADATDVDALRRAYEEIRQNYSQVNGVIHSAIVLSDQSLANMKEEDFQVVLTPKVDISVRLAQVFPKDLDFVLFFSSMIAFTKTPGQSNYSSGCTFKDAFAHRLSQEWPCAVKIVNWGYWGSVGIVSSKEYRERMARLGVGSIEPQEAMEVLEKLLAGPMPQIAYMKTTQPLPVEK